MPVPLVAHDETNFLNVSHGPSMPCAYPNPSHDARPIIAKLLQSSRFAVVPWAQKVPLEKILRYRYDLIGGCVSLVGNSGMGKTALATVLAGLPGHQQVLKKLQLDVECEWDSNIPLQERCGVLFQQTALLDELIVAAVATC